MEITAWGVFTFAISTIGTILVGIILNMLYEMRSTNNKRMENHENKLDILQKDIETMRSTMPVQYVLRDDFLRSVSNLDTKVDRMTADIAEINKNIGKIVGGEVKT